MSELLRVEGLEAGYGEARVLAACPSRWRQARFWPCSGATARARRRIFKRWCRRHHAPGGRIPSRRTGRDAPCAGKRASPSASAGCRRSATSSARSRWKRNLTAVARPGSWNLDRIYAMFPRLRERRGNLGNQLSGGEQQMLRGRARARGQPDAPSPRRAAGGAGPGRRRGASRRAVSRIVREDGLSAIIVEQKGAAHPEARRPGHRARSRRDRGGGDQPRLSSPTRPASSGISASRG